MAALTVGSLFSGYDGIGLALDEVFGSTQRLWFSENAAAPSKVLAHHWPEVPNLGDITAIDWASVPAVDILTGSFPCTDLSVAGLRAGMHAGTRSGLWSHMATAITHLRPRLVVIENVRGLLYGKAHSSLEQCPGCLDGARRGHVRALGVVLGDLARIGYDAEWLGLRASDVGAPHQRFRIFITAHPADTDLSGLEGRGGQRGDARPERSTIGGGDPVAAWGIYGPAVQRWESILGRSAPAPTTIGNRHGRGLSARFAEFLMGLPAGHVTDVPGLTRRDEITALGNGVVPQQAAEALRHLLTAAAS